LRRSQRAVILGEPERFFIFDEAEPVVERRAGLARVELNHRAALCGKPAQELLHQRQGHAAPLLRWVDRYQADMTNRAIVRPAGDPGWLTIERGDQPAIWLKRQIE